MAVAMPMPQTIAIWKIPTCAPVATAAQTLPQPKKTRMKVPKNSPIAHFGTGVAAISTSAVTSGGGSGRVALFGSSMVLILGGYDAESPATFQVPSARSRSENSALLVSDRSHQCRILATIFVRVLGQRSELSYY